MLYKKLIQVLEHINFKFFRFLSNKVDQQFTVIIRKYILFYRKTSTFIIKKYQSTENESALCCHHQMLTIVTFLYILYAARVLSAYTPLLPTTSRNNKEIFRTKFELEWVVYRVELGNPLEIIVTYSRAAADIYSHI